MADKHARTSTEAYKIIPYDENCTVKHALDLFQHKWYMRVIFELLRQNVLRFGEIKSLIPEITNTMLTGTLRRLEAEGIISRTQFNEIPPHVEYSLTEKGQALRPILTAIVGWSQKYITKV